jgi:4-amino-4-deoxy-L-arabinose transferase-like glycosyltransferase
VARAGLVAVVLAFLGLSLAVALLTPPWENPDEASHVLNVETLDSGHWYVMRAGAGYEAHQPPLYYLILAGWQKALQIPILRQQPESTAGLVRDPSTCRRNACEHYRHDLPRESSDRRLERWLRLPGIVAGATLLVLTAAIARRISTDPWTPVVAAALVASVPRFVFTSAAVNNDNLVNVLGGAMVLLSIVLVNRAPVRRTREVWWAGVLLGVLAGLLLLTKLSAVPLAIVAVVAVVACCKRATIRFDLMLLACASALIVTGWWLIRNVQLYGDPLAARYSRSYLQGAHGGVLLRLGFPRHYGWFRILFVDVPHLLYTTFWYSSTWGHLPMWIALAAALVGLGVTSRTPKPRSAHLVILIGAVVASVVGLGLVTLQTATAHASITYGGLAALACLAALGLERLPIPTAARFTGPALGTIITLVAIQHDLIAFYH